MKTIIIYILVKKVVNKFIADNIISYIYNIINNFTFFIFNFFSNNMSIFKQDINDFSNKTNHNLN